MVASSDEVENDRLGRRPVMDHLVVAESEDDVTELHEAPVAGAIGLVPLDARVVGTAVDLDDQSFTDQEIDATDSGNTMLRRDGEPTPRGGGGRRRR
jgi:L-serine deaminase